MKTNSRKRSPTVGEFIGRAYGVCLPHDLAHHGGTDADHLPVIPGNDFPPDASQRDEFPLPTTAQGDTDMTGLRLKS